MAPSGSEGQAPRPRPSGRVCIVTGASSGIGEQTALGLARLGDRVILVCRSHERGKRALERIVGQTGNDAVELVLADLSSQLEVRRLADELLYRCPRIDVLVNNAGVLNVAREVTADGREACFAVNHLAYFLLTCLLLGRLAEHGGGRVVNVASVAHRWGRIDFADLDAERRYNAVRVYGNTKLANVLFTRELARRAEGLGVSVNCVHPGCVATGLGRNNGPLSRAFNRFLGLFFCSPEQGAEASIWVATAPRMRGVTGGYVIRRRVKRPSRRARNAETAARLWQASCRLTGIPDLPPPPA